MVSSFAHGTYPLLKEIKDRKGPWVSVAPEPSTRGKTEQARTAFTASLHTLLPAHPGKVGIGEYNKVKAFRIVPADLQVVLAWDLKHLHEGQGFLQFVW